MTKIQELKYENMQKIRACFYAEDVWIKNDLSKATGLSLASVTNSLQYLALQGEISYIGDADSTGGRKSKKYILNKDYYHIGQLLLQRNSEAYTINWYECDLEGNAVRSGSLRSADGYVKEILSCVKELTDHSTKLHTVCVSVPGIVHEGVVGDCDYPSLRGISLKEMIETEYNLCCITENDVNAACAGFAKKHLDVQNLALVYQPQEDFTGCGLYLNGSLYKGFRSSSGEFRYVPFLSEKKQLEFLKKDPVSLLEKQIGTVAALFDPDLIGWHSDCFEGTGLFSGNHYPRLIEEKDMTSLIREGLHTLGKKHVLNSNIKDV